MLELLERALIRETEEFACYQGKSIRMDKTTNIVDGMFAIAASITDLADAIRSLKSEYRP
jgi:hypothetical protein